MVVSYVAPSVIFSQQLFPRFVLPLFQLIAVFRLLPSAWLPISSPAGLPHQAPGLRAVPGVQEDATFASLVRPQN